MGRMIGYVRSTAKPASSREVQEHALADKGVHAADIFMDAEASEAGADRPGLDAALGALNSGDTLVVSSLDRLAHSTQALQQLATELRTKGAQLRVLALEEPGDPDLGTVNGQGLMRLLIDLAEMERTLQKERMNASVRRRRSVGSDPSGRRERYTDDEIREAAKAIKAGASKVEIAAKMGMSRATLYRRMAVLEEKGASTG